MKPVDNFFYEDVEWSDRMVCPQYQEVNEEEKLFMSQDNIGRKNIIIQEDYVDFVKPCCVRTGLYFFKLISHLLRPRRLPTRLAE